VRISLVITIAMATCVGCAVESSPTSQVRAGNAAPPCTAGCGAAAGAAAAAPPLTDVDNPSPIAARGDAGVRMPRGPARDCSPGLYLGTYECEISIFGLPVPLAGDVSFNLSINETTVDGQCMSGQEFCADLVISKNGGTLFGLAGLIGFETMLEGALDCTTGTFRASGLGGRWGNAVSMDPNDPDALWTIEDPPFGRFDGELKGMHTASPSETIAGDWNLREPDMDITCAGPFTVTLQP
jgi:hypothetical protein